MTRTKTKSLDRKRENARTLTDELLEKQGGGRVDFHEEPHPFTSPARSQDSVSMRRKSKAELRLEQQGIPVQALDDLIRQWGGPQALLGDGGLLQAMTKALVERALQAELTHHLGYEKGDAPPATEENRRNGSTRKTVRTTRGDLSLDVPRDRMGSFEPVFVPKHERHFRGFDDQILGLYGRGFSDRDIQAFFQEQYGTQVSPDLISRVTNAVVEDLRAWQSRPLEQVYPIVYLDALFVKIRDTGVVQNKAVYLAVGVTLDGNKEVLGMWVQATEGAKFWLGILTELKQRGVQDVLVLCADGLNGLPDAVEAAFPRTIFQTCIVHMIRSSLRYVPWQDRKNVAAKLRFIYTAPNEPAARQALEDFEREYGQRYPKIAPAWRNRWEELTPFLAFPAEIRRAIYTTNAIEALNRHIRKVLKTKGHLPTEEAAVKLVYLNIQNAKKWGRPSKSWGVALQQFAIYFADRLPQGAVS